MAQLSGLPLTSRIADCWIKKSACWDLRTAKTSSDSYLAVWVTHVDAHGKSLFPKPSWNKAIDQACITIAIWIYHYTRHLPTHLWPKIGPLVSVKEAILNETLTLSPSGKLTILNLWPHSGHQWCLPDVDTFFCYLYLMSFFWPHCYGSSNLSISFSS